MVLQEVKIEQNQTQDEKNDDRMYSREDMLDVRKTVKVEFL